MPTRRLRLPQAKVAAFAAAYVVSFSAEKAAEAVGYAKSTASVQAWYFLDQEEVQQAIRDAMAARVERTHITADRVLLEIASMALYDPAEFASLTGPEAIKDLPEDVRRAIAGWKWDRNGKFILTLASKPAALDMLAKHLGMYAPIKLEHDLGSAADKLRGVLGELYGRQ